jgi:serine/threonine protein kinase
MDIWNNYEEKRKISTIGYSSIYKAKNIKTKQYVAIKEIDKNKCKINIEKLKNEMNKMKLIDNIINIKEIIEDKNILYLLMDLCSFNLEDYLKMRDKPFSIYEIKQFLFELNKSLKILKDEKIINGNIKLSNILININEFNKTSIKLSYYDSIKFFDKSEYSLNVTDYICYSIPPEIIINGTFNNKSDIWSLGIIIYYMLYKKYPFEGKTEYNLYQNIKSNKITKFIEDEELNDLLIKMLKEDINERISWEDYFNHSFFNQNDFPKFNFK